MRCLLHLALCFGLMLPAAPLLAHALPGTSLTIWTEVSRTRLTITMPLHELDLAMPEASGLGPSPAIGPVPQDATARIAKYLADHLSMTDAEGERIDANLSAARVEDTYDDHVGNYRRLVIDLVAPAISFPLTLQYDAIMHEVRNHQAAVYVQVPRADPIAISVVRLDPATGKSTSLVIPAPSMADRRADDITLP